MEEWKWIYEQPYNYLKTDMNKRTIITVLSILIVGTSYGQRTVEKQVTLENKSKIEQENYPVSVDIRNAFGDGTEVKSALVRLDGVEIPCQIDDLDGDRRPDEVFFLASLPKELINFPIEVLLIYSLIRFLMRVWSVEGIQHHD